MIKRTLALLLLTPALALSSPWKYSADGLTAFRTIDGHYESRLVSAIPASELTSALPADAPVLADVQASALLAIDAQAGETRKKYITDTAGQEATYLSKYNDAVAYKAAGYPSLSITNYPMVQAEGKAINGATPTAVQYQAAADYIIVTQAQWLAKAADIEQQRRAGKIAVSNALTAAAAITARDAAINAIKAL